MQKDLEVLKSEDGLVIKKLSARKLLFVQNVPIYLLDSNVEISNITIKFRYIESDNEVWQSSVHNVDYKIMSRSKIINRLSRKFFVKMDKLSWDGYSNHIVDIKENKYKFDFIVKCLYICDKVWVRDYLLKKIL